MQIDMRVMELLASKVCHDLVSPVSAINNGVELIEDIGGSVVDEAMKLIGNSGVTAARRLRLFRMAYGRAGTDDSIGIKEVRQVAEQYLSGGKATLIWPEGQPVADIAAQRGFLKTILNLIILAEETLAYGGIITMREIGTEGPAGCRLEIVGRNAQLSPQLLEALEGNVDVDALSPRSIQAYITGRFATHFGLRFACDNAVTDRLELSLFMPVAQPEVEIVSGADLESEAIENLPPEHYA
jgi:histidine phosphotransferase ChpT